MAPASFAVDAQLEISRLDHLGGGLGHAVVFFESAVADYQVLCQGLAAGTDAVILDTRGDGLREMAAFLASRRDLTAIEVVAHGAPGVMALGTAVLDEQSLKSYAHDLAELGSTLRPGGELDLWSCDVAAGKDGLSFVRDVAAVTGSGVAAADHPVGAPALGGSWQLDVKLAGARAQVPFSAANLGVFNEVLGVWSPAASMSTPRAGQTATLLNSGKVLVTGGDASGGTLASAELYDPVKNTWSSAGSMSKARTGHTATLLGNGQVLVTGGENVGGGILSSAELYDPVKNTWSSAGSMAAARSHHTGTLLSNGQVLVAGGYYFNIFLGTAVTTDVAELYDPTSNTWSSAGPLAKGRSDHSATLLASGRVLVTGGVNFGLIGVVFLSTAELYDPLANSWSPAASMSTARATQTATLLENSRVLVVGGQAGASVLSSAELYDPTSNTWSSAGSLATKRVKHTATLLENGQVLVAAGSNGAGAVASAELYDPISNTWSPAPSMATPRGEQTATLLTNGQVLVAGGSSISGVLTVLSSAELYDPARDTITLFATGVDKNGAVLADGSVDPHFSLFSVPSGSSFGPSAFVADQNKFPLSTHNWFADSTTSKWIGPVADQSTMVEGNGNVLDGIYIYRTTFDLTGLNPNTAMITGQWASDNAGVDILINGRSTGISNTTQFSGFSSFTISSGFQNDINTLDFEVSNDPGTPGVQNPSGFRVEMRGSAAPARPTSQLLVNVLSGNTVVAGSSFLFTVQAADQSGNPVSSYSGPSSVTIATTPADPQGNLPVTATLNSSGFGFFQGTLKTAGSYTLTATASSFSGASASMTVTPSTATYFKVSAPATASTGSPLSVSVTALDLYGNIATGYAGFVHFTSSDASATLQADDKLTNGVGTFKITLNAAGSQTISATDTTATSPPITGTSKAITTRGLVVSTFAPTADGFQVAFSKPFIPGDVTLYGSSLTSPQDVVLVGASTGPVVGSLIPNSDNTGFTFKASSAPLLTFHGAPVLPDDTYTVTLVSGTASNGFLDALGAGLDGANNAGHANYTTTFTVMNSSKPVLSIPDFARGPDASHNIQIPNDNGHGIPISLYNAAKVTDVIFSLTCNSSLLAVTGAGTGDASAPGSTFKLLPTVPPANIFTFSFHNNSPQSGTVVLGDILADVPNSAGSFYKAKELLQLSNVTVNGAAFTGVAGSSVHVNAYLGDVTGNGTIDGLDVATANSVARGTATGFNAYPLLDPAIVGDPASDISVDAGDVSDLAAYTVHLPMPAIPAIPAGVTITSVGADPTLSLGAGLRAIDGIVSVPVLLDHPHPVGSTGMTEAILALSYDPSVMSVSASDVTLGSIPSLGQGWQLNSVVDQTTGQVGIELYGTTPIASAQAGSLVNIAFHVLPGASSPATAVQLVNGVMASGQAFTTQVDDAQGRYVLSQGLDRVIVDAVSPVMAVAPAGTGIAETTTASHQVFLDRPVLGNVEATAVPFPLGPDATDGLTVMRSSVAAGVATAAELLGQVFQLGSTPLLNALLYRNSPAQAAADRLFLALGRRNTGLDDADALWDGALLRLDWQEIPKLDDLRGSTNDQQAAEQPTTRDRRVVVDKVLASLGDDMEGLSDLGD